MSSCKFCNEIIVFDQGGIIQKGNHNELINQKKVILRIMECTSSVLYGVIYFYINNKLKLSILNQ